MNSTRREFIAGTGAAIAALSSLAACAKREAAPAAVDPLAGIADEMLADYPENATSLGIDNGARAGLKARLTDRSAAGQQAIAKRVAERLAGLRNVDAGTLDDAARIDLDVVRTAHETASLGQQTVEVRVRATLPLVGLLGAARGLEVTAHAPVESFD